MRSSIRAERGWVDIRTRRRKDRRWDCECRFVAPNGDCFSWTPTVNTEGYGSRDDAIEAGIALGRSLAAWLAAAPNDCCH
ncbi:hypothetical protein D7S78_14780 [Ralstonia pickettii]|jgi:hypothetical protein|uniref:Uncharacterized protein n=1 Tax=Ralstonia pickettii (strain 12J) TaxID=402626 RepID=B2UJI6_RALPJ|nr:hypothetical protein [Ralstonia pickettii]MBA9892936.1 hypothetical protein [Ralstonia pickettii]MBA9925049.1 hypothetical protein [Ralstonia pickettii]MBB0093552.1 hypothetical protein [Ralstonia pickettii]MBB0102737.1 hypothetical protein [Ralstonia pickettii]